VRTGDGVDHLRFCEVGYFHRAPRVRDGSDGSADPPPNGLGTSLSSSASRRTAGEVDLLVLRALDEGVDRGEPYDTDKLSLDRITNEHGFPIPASEFDVEDFAGWLRDAEAIEAACDALGIKPPPVDVGQAE
jgi:hypothetical protein